MKTTRRRAIIASVLAAVGAPTWATEKQKDGTIISATRVFLNLDQVRSLTVIRGNYSITLDADEIWKALHE